MSDTADIEYQTTSGNWLRSMNVQNRPSMIKSAMEATLKGNPNITKVRAVDSKTKQLIDIAFKQG